MREIVDGHDVVRIRAENPGPLTLSGSNTWVVGRDPAWVVDPGPDLAEHVATVAEEVAARGGAGGIAITHRHVDHVEAVPALQAALGQVLAHGMAFGEARIGDGDRIGPLEAIRVPGHSPDHLAFVYGTACLTGDAVMGEGSVFIADDMGGYLEALRRLREMDLDVILPGHGPPVHDPAAKLDEYIDHRMDRHRRLTAALEQGLRSETELLDAVWDDVPTLLRSAAAVTLRAHLRWIENG